MVEHQNIQKITVLQLQVPRDTLDSLLTRNPLSSHLGGIRMSQESYYSPRKNTTLLHGNGDRNMTAARRWERPEAARHAAMSACVTRAFAPVTSP